MLNDGFRLWNCSVRCKGTTKRASTESWMTQPIRLIKIGWIRYIASLFIGYGWILLLTNLIKFPRAESLFSPWLWSAKIMQQLISCSLTDICQITHHVVSKAFLFCMPWNTIRRTTWLNCCYGVQTQIRCVWKWLTRACIVSVVAFQYVYVGSERAHDQRSLGCKCWGGVGSVEPWSGNCQGMHTYAHWNLLHSHEPFCIILTITVFDKSGGEAQARHGAALSHGWT